MSTADSDEYHIKDSNGYNDLIVVGEPALVRSDPVNEFVGLRLPWRRLGEIKLILQKHPPSYRAANDQITS
jgi:hypothetical protein